jgi:hypothetical protein
MPSHSSLGQHSSSSLHRVYRDNGAILQTGPTANKLSWTDSVTYGENIPGWRENLRKGLSATTSMTGSLVEIRYTPGLLSASVPKIGTGTHIYKVEVVGGLRIGEAIPGSDPSGLSESESNAKALGKFVQRMYEVQHAFQGGVFLGELRQTLQTIRNPAQGLRRAVDDWGYTARRLRRNSRAIPVAYRKKKLRENLADAWLEVQYGWRPLLNDIAQGSKALERYKSGQGLDLRRITAKAQVEGNPSSSQTSQTQNGLAVWVTTERTVSRVTVIYRGAMRVDARDPRTMDPALLGFDLASWVPTAWELVPYSFLVDYFSNVGEVILGWSSLGTRMAWCNRTARKEYEYTTGTNPAIPAGVSLETYVPAKFFCSKRVVSRAKYEGLLVPDLTFEIPGSGSLKWLNIAALIASRKADRKWSFD